MKRPRSNDLRSLGGHYLLWSLCWFSIDRSIIITKCTRKGIYKQHLLCNTPLLKVADTSQIHGTIKYFEWLWSPADNGSEEVRIMYWHTTSHWIDWVDIQGLVCDNPFQESEVLLWHSSILQRITFHHGDAVM